MLVDEAYVDFGGESAVPLIADHPNLLVVQTMSKSRALAGLRVGYALGDAGLIEALRRVKDSFNSYPLGRVAQVGATASLRDDAYFRKSCAQGHRRARSDDARVGEARFRRPAVERKFRLRPASAAERGGTGGGAARACGAGAAFQQAAHGAWLRITVGTEDDIQRLIAAAADILGT